MRRSIAHKLVGMTLDEALSEPELLGSALVGDASSWAPWRAFLAALFGSQLSTKPASFASVRVARRCLAGISHLRPRRRQKLHHVFGRVLSRGLPQLDGPACAGRQTDRAFGCATREQAKILLDYIVGILDQSPILRRLIANITANSVELTTRVSVEVV